MATASLNLVEFVGGPFDGFCQRVRDEIDDLPERVAIPVNQRSARVLGLDAAPPDSNHKVIYHLQLSAGVARYCFHDECVRAGTQSKMISEIH